LSAGLRSRNHESSAAEMTAHTTQVHAMIGCMPITAGFEIGSGSSISQGTRVSDASLEGSPDEPWN
jgi:hypothetical protein